MAQPKAVFFLKNDDGTFTTKDGMDIVYPIEVEYGDFGIKFTELKIGIFQFNTNCRTC